MALLTAATTVCRLALKLAFETEQQKAFLLVHSMEDAMALRKETSMESGSVQMKGCWLEAPLEIWWATRSVRMEHYSCQQ